jgi:DNA-binding LacI/PurR family transcriptional regulator
MSLTQHEIVNQLGISRGTLHRILIGSPLVKPATRERVLRELEKMHYVPNAIARGMKMRRTNTLGIIGPAAIKMANIDKVNSLYLTARERGYSVMFGYSNGSLEEDARCIRELRSRMVDGFIALGRGLAQSARQYQSLQESGTPFVTLYPIPGLHADCVYVDTRSAYAELTRHLIKLGHTKIGLLLDGSSSQFSVNRELGFRDAMTSASLPVVEEWIIHVTPDGSSRMSEESEEEKVWHISDYQYGFWGASLILAKRQRPTALVCFSDEFAIGVLRAADLAGVRVPDELALVGYDDKDSAKFARVPLTTMHQPDNEIGTEAVSLLIDRIDGKLPPDPVVRPLEAKLVIRDSCGAKLAKNR